MGEKKKREKIMLQGERLGLLLTEMLGHPGNKSILSGYEAGGVCFGLVAAIVSHQKIFLSGNKFKLALVINIRSEAIVRLYIEDIESYFLLESFQRLKKTTMQIPVFGLNELPIS